MTDGLTVLQVFELLVALAVVIGGGVWLYAWWKHRHTDTDADL